MQIFKTGKQVTQAVKNVQRLRVILTTFGRHGLQEFLIRMGFQRYLPTFSKSEEIEKLTVPERLRMAFESLGPAFIKLGQLFGNRPDMIPEAFIEEFKKLQDHVAPLPFETIRLQIERELGGKLEDHYSFFNPNPLASASIGQVHEARLKNGGKDAEDVVVKVQRPDIEKIIKTDISILMFLANMVEKYIPELRLIRPTQVIEEFFVMLQYELDFIVEANTTQKVAENFRNHSKVVIPKVYRKVTTRRILTLERLHGVRITDVEKLKELNINPSELVEVGARAFFKMVLQDGLFHGDLHGGNLFAIKDPTSGESKIGVIDFGIVGRLSQKSRDSFSRMLLYLILEDYDSLCYEYAELGATGTGIDFDGFQREVRNALSPHMGLNLRDVNVGVVLINSTKVAFKYRIQVPSDWMIVFKAIFTLEGLGRQLDPDFDLLTIGQELIKSLIKDRYSLERLAKDFAWIARDISALLQIAPRQIRWMIKKFNSNDFAFEMKLKEMEVLRRQIERSFRGLGFSVVCSGFFIAAALSLQNSTQPVLAGHYSLPFLVFSILGAIGFLFLLLRHWR